MTTLPEIEEKINHINRVHQEPIGKKPLCAMNLEEFIEIQKPKKALRLTIKQKHFDITKDGIKNMLFLRPTNWIRVRILDHKYDYIELSVGYGDGAAMLTAEYKGFSVAEWDHFIKFNDSERIEVKKGDYVIKLGRVISVKE